MPTIDKNKTSTERFRQAAALITFCWLTEEPEKTCTALQLLSTLSLEGHGLSVLENEKEELITKLMTRLLQETDYLYFECVSVVAELCLGHFTDGARQEADRAPDMNKVFATREAIWKILRDGGTWRDITSLVEFCRMGDLGENAVSQARPQPPARSKTQIMQIPEELQARILRYCPSTTLVRARSTCQKWYRIGFPIQYETVRIRSSAGFAGFAEHLRHRPNRACHVRRLCYDLPYKWEDDPYLCATLVSTLLLTVRLNMLVLSRYYAHNQLDINPNTLVMHLCVGRMPVQVILQVVGVLGPRIQQMSLYHDVGHEEEVHLSTDDIEMVRWDVVRWKCFFKRLPNLRKLYLENQGANVDREEIEALAPHDCEILPANAESFEELLEDGDG